MDKLQVRLFAPSLYIPCLIMEKQVYDTPVLPMPMQEAQERRVSLQGEQRRETGILSTISQLQWHGRWRLCHGHFGACTGCKSALVLRE